MVFQEVASVLAAGCHGVPLRSPTNTTSTSTAVHTGLPAYPMIVEHCRRVFSSFPGSIRRSLKVYKALRVPLWLRRRRTEVTVFGMPVENPGLLMSSVGSLTY